tara:strand:- start:6344 stop:6796 length:453 start_codon:yes stop_codon:yes gene_type:complete
MPKNLLKWWLIVVMTFSAVIIANYFDGISFLWNHDSTKISFVILAVFTLSTAIIGFKIFMTERKQREYQSYEGLWFSAEALLSLGLTGTVLGFCMVLIGTFQGLNLSSPESVQGAISSMASGIGTALLTTLMGIVTSTILKAQLVTAESE